jgi:hypothetical protein
MPGKCAPLPDLTEAVAALFSKSAECAEILLTATSKSSRGTLALEQLAQRSDVVVVSFRVLST